MIRMMNLLIQQYKDRGRIYLSWDAASWHVSKELNERIEKHNNLAIGPIVVVCRTAPRARSVLKRHRISFQRHGAGDHSQQ